LADEPEISYPTPSVPGPETTLPPPPLTEEETPSFEPTPNDIPPLEDVGDALEEFSDSDGEVENPEELAQVKSFAARCLGLHASCGWWIDFCCWQWWDWCCLPWYWDCWVPCYWDYVYCPQQVVIIGGVQEICEEMTYYVGVRGSQIPGFGFGIQEVKIDSPAEFAGLVAGDVIVSVNRQPMTDKALLAYELHRTGGVLDLEIASEGNNDVRLLRVVAEAIPVASF
jgi:hypothetical protein